MEKYHKYVCVRRFRGNGICGWLNLPYGTECTADGKFIHCEKGLICTITSQNAYDYFAQNDDDEGFLRGELIRGIRKVLEADIHNENGKYIGKHQAAWNRVWGDHICLKYRRKEIDDHWLWNYEFYNAGIDDLKHIHELVRHC